MLLISVVQQSDSVIHIFNIYIDILFKNMLFHYSLSENIEYSLLCYAVGACSFVVIFNCSLLLRIHSVTGSVLSAFKKTVCMMFNFHNKLGAGELFPLEKGKLGKVNQLVKSHLRMT